MQDLASELRTVVEEAEKRLRAIPEDGAASSSSGDHWSAKQILGHLIDSAANNHRRFVEAQLKDDLVFPGYEQERWVVLQGYRSEPWTGLVTLWKMYNLHLAHIVSSIPDEVLKRPRERHTLDTIAWQTMSADTPVSLEYMIRDYIDHLQDHLKQIYAVSSSRSGG